MHTRPNGESSETELINVHIFPSVIRLRSSEEVLIFFWYYYLRRKNYNGKKIRLLCLATKRFLRVVGSTKNFVTYVLVLKILQYFLQITTIQTKSLFLLYHRHIYYFGNIVIISDSLILMFSFVSNTKNILINIPNKNTKFIVTHNARETQEKCDGKL